MKFVDFTRFLTIFSSPNVAVSATKLPENRSHRPETSVFWAENDILKLSSSSPIEMKVVNFLSRFLTPFWLFLVILGQK